MLHFQGQKSLKTWLIPGMFSAKHYTASSLCGVCFCICFSLLCLKEITEINFQNELRSKEIEKKYQEEKEKVMLMHQYTLRMRKEMHRLI